LPPRVLRKKLMIDNKFVRWDRLQHELGERCEATGKDSQCPYCKVEGSNYCSRHGGYLQQKRKDAEAMRGYRLGRWKARVGELSDSSGIKSLREEIGILRMMLEEMIGQCTDATDILLYSQRMSDLVMKIEKLVTSCDKLENRMGMLLSKDSVLQLASTYIQIINMHVTDPEVIEQIGTEMAEATEQINGPVDL